MADQVPALVDNAAVIQALDGQAPQDHQAVQARQDDTLANQVQAVSPIQPWEPAANMVGSFFSFYSLLIHHPSCYHEFVTACG